jgi:SAM-dependent methyltransferase
MHLKPALRTARDVVYRIAYRGAGRFCPICETAARRFRPFGIEIRRPQAMCVYCRSLERDRLTWLFLERRTELLAPNPPAVRFLHLAPEPCLARRLRPQLGAGYVTGDLEDRSTDVRLDVMRLPYDDGVFDVIHCSHVLEHVADDRAALRELRRVLAPGGMALVFVPISADRTWEDPRITDPHERLVAFGQRDHVRRYGPDVVERVRAAGFDVRVVRDADLATPHEIATMGLRGSGDIYLATPV